MNDLARMLNESEMKKTEFEMKWNESERMRNETGKKFSIVRKNLNQIKKAKRRNSVEIITTPVLQLSPIKREQLPIMLKILQTMEKVMPYVHQPVHPI